MKIIRIAQIGEPVIRQQAKKVVHPKSLVTQKLIKKLHQAMTEASLVGIAAPQVGSSQRVFLTQPRKTKFRSTEIGEKLRVYINPRIISRSAKKEIGYEGCGSVDHAGIFGIVPRSTSLTIKAQDEHGAWFTLQATGFLARVIQHEFDHLEGKVFLDRVQDTTTLMVRKEYLKRKK